MPVMDLSNCEVRIWMKGEHETEWIEITHLMVKPSPPAEITPAPHRVEEALVIAARVRAHLDRNTVIK